MFVKLCRTVSDVGTFTAEHLAYMQKLRTGFSGHFKSETPNTGNNVELIWSLKEQWCMTSPTIIKQEAPPRQIVLSSMLDSGFSRVVHLTDEFFDQFRISRNNLDYIRPTLGTFRLFSCGTLWAKFNGSECKSGVCNVAKFER